MIRYFSEIGSAVNRRGGGADPLAVLNFDVTLYNPDGVDEQTAILTWTANSLYETEIYRSLDGDSFALLTTVAPNIYGYEDELMDGDEHTVEYYARHKNDQTVLNAPIIGTASFTATGTTVTCTGNNTEAVSIEVWCDIAGAGFNLLASEAYADNFTYNHATTETDLTYKFRAKSGTLPVYSFYSADLEAAEPDYLAEADAVFAKAISLGAAYSVPRKILINSFIQTQKDDGLWDLTYADWWLLEGAVKGRINIKSPDNFYLANVGANSPTWTQDDGVKPANVGEELNSGFNPSANSVNKDNFAIHWYSKTNGTGGYVFGATGGTPASYLYHGLASSVIFDATGYVFVGADMSESGCLERSASNRVDLYRNGISVGNKNITSTNVLNQDIYILGAKNQVGFTSVNNKFSRFAFTQKMTAQQHTDWVANELVYLGGL